MDDALKANLDRAKQVVKNDWDMFFIVDGKEGSGKSVFAQQIGYFLDPTLNIDRIVFTPEDFQQAIYSASKYQTIIYDEAYFGLSSRGAMTKINKMLVKMFTEIRDRNLFVIIVLPSIFILDKIPAMWRSRALFHVYDVSFARGYFGFYNYERKKQLYLYGKQSYDSRSTKPNFTGRFSNKYMVNVDEYKEKKKRDTERTTKDEDMEGGQSHTKIYLAAIPKLVELGMNQRQIGETLGISSVRVGQIIKEYKDVLNIEWGRGYKGRILPKEKGKS